MGMKPMSAADEAYLKQGGPITASEIKRREAAQPVPLDAHLRPLILATARILLAQMRDIQNAPAVQPDLDLYDEMRALAEALEPFEPDLE